MSIYVKDPQARIDYAIDWPTTLIGAATIATSGWAVEPVENGGVSVASSSFSGARCIGTLEGGVPGQIYRVRNRIVLSDGRSDERSLNLRVEDR